MKYQALLLSIKTVPATNEDGTPKRNAGTVYAEIGFVVAGKRLPDQNDFAKTMKFLRPEQIALYKELALACGWDGSSPVVNLNIAKEGIIEEKRFHIEQLPPFMLYEQDANGNITSIPRKGPNGQPIIYTELRVLIDYDDDGNPKIAPNNHARRIVSELGKWVDPNQATVTNTTQQVDNSAQNALDNIDPITGQPVQTAPASQTPPAQNNPFNQ